MVNRRAQSVFPLLSSVVYLTILAAVLICILHFVMRVALQPSAGSGEAVLWMGMICWVTGLLGLLPVALAGSRTVLSTVRAYFTGAVLRVLLSLLAVLLFVKGMGLPPAPVVVTLMVIYLPMLYLETFIVVRYIKGNDFVEIAPVREGVQ